MRIGIGKLAALALLTWTFSLGALAHHSFAMFDMNKTLEFSGVIKVFEFTHPHSWLRVETEEKGQKVLWGFEGSGPNRTNAWMKKLLTPGTKVTVWTHPFRDGKPLGTLERVQLSDGTVIHMMDLLPANSNFKPEYPKEQQELAERMSGTAK